MFSCSGCATVLVLAVYLGQKCQHNFFWLEVTPSGNIVPPPTKTHTHIHKPTFGWKRPLIEPHHKNIWQVQLSTECIEYLSLALGSFVSHRNDLVGNQLSHRRPNVRKCILDRLLKAATSQIRCHTQTFPDHKEDLRITLKENLFSVLAFMLKLEAGLEQI